MSTKTLHIEGPKQNHLVSEQTADRPAQTGALLAIGCGSIMYRDDLAPTPSGWMLLWLCWIRVFNFPEPD
ncbi:MAG TPA: hypothetical protein VII29_04980, partial [Terriglobales bacterium]